MSLRLPEASANDLLNSQNNRMKSIALEFFKIEKHAARHHPDGF
jgi:hypothetical protein